MVDTYTWRDLENKGHVSSFETVNYDRQLPNGSSEALNGDLQKVLKAYRLDPRSSKIEQTGRVYRISAKGQTWALKKVDPSALKRTLLFHQVAQNGPIRTPPLILSQSGTPYYLDAHTAYILTPWIQASTHDSTRSSDRFWDTLAEWHRTTGERCEIDSEWVESFSSRCLEIWSEQVLTLDLFMNDCEHRVYPSPFEQRFMAFYNELRAGAETAYRKMTDWRDQVRDESTIRVVYCQGKPSPDHLITSGRQHNWVSNETAGQDLPVRDLTWVFRWGMSDRRVEEATLTHALDLYETTFPLEEQEKLLLSAQACHPARPVSLLHRYKQGKGRYFERDYTVELERTYHHWGRTVNALSHYLESQKADPSDKEKDQIETKRD